MDNQPPLIAGYATKDEAFINAAAHDMLDGLLIATQAAVSVQIDHCTDIVNVWPCLLPFCVVILGELMNIENHFVLVRRFLGHFERVLDLV